MGFADEVWMFLPHRKQICLEQRMGSICGLQQSKIVQFSHKMMIFCVYTHGALSIAALSMRHSKHRLEQSFQD